MRDGACQEVAAARILLAGADRPSESLSDIENHLRRAAHELEALQTLLRSM